MMDRSTIRLKYWSEGRHVFIGDEEYQFSNVADAKRVIQIIETIDISQGGIKHTILPK